MGNEQPLISIIVPVYNVEKYLNRCISSILKQTYTNFELILVDDESPDNCPQLCDQWAKRDSRIRVIHKPHGGLSDTRNVGIQLAKGDYLAFVDSDDWISPQMYQIMISAIRETNSELACCGRYRVNKNNYIRMFCLPSITKFNKIDAIKEILIHGCMDEAVWDKLYKRELFTGIRFPVGENNEDIVVILPIIHKCKTIVHIGLPLYYYYSNPNGITSSNYDKSKRVYLKHINQTIQFIINYYPSLKYEAKIFEADYSLNILTNLLSEKKILLNYFNDYKIYKKKLKESYFYMLIYRKCNIKNKIEGFLILLGVYRIARTIKKYFEVKL